MVRNCQNFINYPKKNQWTNFNLQLKFNENTRNKRWAPQDTKYQSKLLSIPTVKKKRLEANPPSPSSNCPTKFSKYQQVQEASEIRVWREISKLKLARLSAGRNRDCLRKKRNLRLGLAGASRNPNPPVSLTSRVLHPTLSSFLPGVHAIS